MKTIDLERWRGRRDAEELDPAVIEFRAQHSPKSCAGCLFAGQWARVCNRAAELARLRGVPDCDSGVIYVAVERDPRQMEFGES